MHSAMYRCRQETHGEHHFADKERLYAKMSEAASQEGIADEENAKGGEKKLWQASATPEPDDDGEGPSGCS